MTMTETKKRRYNQSFSPENIRIFILFMMLIAIVVVEVVLVERAIINFVNNMSPINHANTSIDTPLKSIKQILLESGISVSVSEESSIPRVQDIVKLYGSTPKIIGLDTCKAFQKNVAESERMIAPAGLFNTGTNLIDVSLEANCYIPARMQKYGKNSLGMRKHVPWGKHNPVSFRGKHIAEQAGNANVHDILPIVAIKDPYTWMTSMCRHRYACKWNNSGKHCPGLVPITPYEKGFHPDASSLPVRLRYISTNITYYDSLVHLYNTWYNDWLHVTFPRLIVRYEDLLFNLQPVITTICHCAGGKMRKDFQIQSDAAKDMPIHSGSSGLKDALLRYSNATIRQDGYWKEDIEYAKAHLDDHLMHFFSYKHFD